MLSIARWWLQDFLESATWHSKHDKKPVYYGITKPAPVTICQRLISQGIQPEYKLHCGQGEQGIGCYELTLDWSRIPPVADPVSFMKAERGRRKRQQIENMMFLLKSIDSVRDTSRSVSIVDFCSSSGHLGFAIAYYFPHVNVVLVEQNRVAAQNSKERILESCMNNIRIENCAVQDFNEPFEIGVAIHACGSLSDAVQLKCLKNNAVYLLCPCCVGQLQHSFDKMWFRGKGKSDFLGVFNIRYPRSSAFAAVVKPEEYKALTHHADYAGYDFNSEKVKAKLLCKSFIETDRNLAAQELGYEVFLVKMTPQNCTPKGDIIFGYPKGNGNFHAQVVESRE